MSSHKLESHLCRRAQAAIRNSMAADSIDRVSSFFPLATPVPSPPSQSKVVKRVLVQGRVWSYPVRVLMALHYFAPPAPGQLLRSLPSVFHVFISPLTFARVRRATVCHKPCLSITRQLFPLADRKWEMGRCPLRKPMAREPSD